MVRYRVRYDGYRAAGTAYTKNKVFENAQGEWYFASIPM